jgi:SAM-dependent methyltransferase
MTKNRYLAKDSPDAFERERLALLTQFADPITTRRLTDLGVAPGWHCLEVGAGDGSVARWLAGRVGPEGRVLATDLNPRFLGGHRLPNLEVRRHNILEDDFQASHYDLVHCRARLMHLPDPIRALRRLVNAVRPGGWLLVEEADGSASFGAADPGHPRASGFDRSSRTLWAALKASGTMDADFGRRLPALFEELGFRDSGHEGVTLIGRGRDPMARFVHMTGELLRQRFVAAGVLTETEFDELGRAYDDRSFWFVGFTLFGAWGRRGDGQSPRLMRGSSPISVISAATALRRVPMSHAPMSWPSEIRSLTLPRRSMSGTVRSSAWKVPPESEGSSPRPLQPLPSKTKPERSAERW